MHDSESHIPADEKAWEIDKKISADLVESGLILERGKLEVAGRYIWQTKNNPYPKILESDRHPKGVYRTHMLLHETVHHRTVNEPEIVLFIDSEVVADATAQRVLAHYAIDVSQSVEDYFQEIQVIPEDLVKNEAIISRISTELIDLIEHRSEFPQEY